MLEAVAVAVHFENVDVVCQAIEQGAGETFRVEHAGPVFEGQVRSDDRGAALVTLRDHLEQKFGAGLRERHVAEFVYDQELQFGE